MPTPATLRATGSNNRDSNPWRGGAEGQALLGGEEADIASPLYRPRTGEEEPEDKTRLQGDPPEWEDSDAS